jgi:hypothetical protein
MICPDVYLAVKPVGEPYAVAPHVRFDERGWETGRCRMAQATAPILDSTLSEGAPVARQRRRMLLGKVGWKLCLRHRWARVLPALG